MKVIGIDCDGTITPFGFYNPNIPLPWWLFFFLVPFVLLSKPKKSVVEKMRLMQYQGCRFIIVTARPNQFFRFNRWLLAFHHVPFAGLFCVGGGKGSKERKLKVIREEKIEIFVDSNKQIVEFMKRNSVKAVNSLDKVI